MTCSFCGAEIDDIETAYDDEEGNFFCDSECAEMYAEED